MKTLNSFDSNGNKSVHFLIYFILECIPEIMPRKYNRHVNFIVAAFCIALTTNTSAQEFRKFGGFGHTEVTFHLTGGHLLIYSDNKETSHLPFVTITPYAIQEIDKDEAVTMEYNVDDLSKVTYESTFPIDRKVKWNYNELEGIHTLLKGSIKPGTGIEFDVYVIKTSGASTMGEEVISLSPGSVKLLTHLRDWALGKSTVYLQIVFEVDVASGSKHWKDFARGQSVDKFPVVYDAVSARFQIARAALHSKSSWVSMPAGYPKFKEQDDKQFLIIRIPKFDNDTTFDTTVDLLLHDFVSYDFGCSASLRSTTVQLLPQTLSRILAWISLIKYVSEGKLDCIVQ